MFTDKKRVVLLIVISVVMNTTLFVVSYYSNLPLWLDTTGTIYVSYLLGFPAGFIVAIINSIFQAALFYGEESLSFYFVSAITAFLTSVVMNRYKKFNIAKWIILSIALIIVSGGTAVLITYIVNKGVPANNASQVLYYSFSERGLNLHLSSALSVLLVKIPDIVVSLLFCFIAVSLTPRKLKTTAVAVVTEEKRLRG